MRTTGVMSQGSTPPRPGVLGHASVVPAGPFSAGPGPGMDDTPSTGLSLAITAVRRDLEAYAVGRIATGPAERDRSTELAAALAGLQEIFAANLRSLDEPSRNGAAAIAAERRSRTHIQRVCRYSMMLTGRVAPEHVKDPQFEYGFLLHDIGKIKVPASLLATPGALTDREWEVMKQHPETGRALLAGIPFLSGASQIVYAHHERWNGEGYPRGLVGDEIPIGARILALCEAFDAITQDSPYRKASTIADARGEIHRGGRGQFWPEAVNAFLSLSVPDLEAVWDTSLSTTHIVAPPSLGAARTWTLEHLEEPAAKPVGWLARALAKRRGG
jgi:HD-GYP domain-containing protein (c-di-GMP phosphodiesterase class II)